VAGFLDRDLLLELFLPELDELLDIVVGY